MQLLPVNTDKEIDGPSGREYTYLFYEYRSIDPQINSQDIKDTLYFFYGNQKTAVIVETFADEDGFSFAYVPTSEATGAEIENNGALYFWNNIAVKYYDSLGLVWETVKQIASDIGTTAKNAFTLALPIAGIFLIFWGLTLLSRKA